MLDYNQARENRENKLHPADFQPGQEPSFSQGDDFYANSTQATTPFGSDSSQGGFGGLGNFGDQFGGQGSFGSQGNFGDQLGGQGSFGDQFGGQGGFGAGMNGMGMGGFAGSPLPNNGMSGAQPQKSDEDKFYDGVKAVGKGGKTFVTDVMDSFSTVTPRFWSNYGFKSCIAGILASVLGLVILLVAGKGVGAQVIIAGLITMAVGVVVWLFNVEKAKECPSEYKDIQEPSMDDANQFQQTPQPELTPSQEEQNPFPQADPDDYSDDDEYVDDEDLDDDDFEEADTVEASDGVSADVALDTMPDIPKGMYTRTFLYEMFTKTLPQIKPDFNKVTEYTDEDDIFILWDSWVQEAGQVCGCKQDNLPMLLSLKVTLFAFILECDRPSGFKPDAVGEELCNIYADRAVDEGVETKHPDRSAVSATVENSGMRCKITIKNGKTALIGLRDMLETDYVKEFFLDTNNYMPIVIGVDQLGHVIYADFKKVESVLITGMPRSGKSWFVQVVLTQMCGFLGPDDLNLYICDPKGDISDFKSFTLPHVKKFATTDGAILSTLRYLINTEAPRRKKLIGDAGNVNIWDYKERYPDVKMPLIYVVIDEVVTLAERMDKETKADFQGMLTVLVSQLPALGIRIFMIPHVIKNDIISKTTTDLIQCRISVMGTPDHIESSTGTKPREFKTKLASVGDMAVRMPIIEASTFFSHGPALTESNSKNNAFFDYLRRMWNKLDGVSEPEQIDASVDANGNVHTEGVSTDESSKHLQFNATAENNNTGEGKFYDPLADDSSDPFS